MKYTNDFIESYLKTNLSDWKIQAIHHLDDILKVNELLTDDDISTLTNDSSFYDSLFSYELNDTLDNYFMDHINIDCNTNEIMIYLFNIYS